MKYKNFALLIHAILLAVCAQGQQELTKEQRQVQQTVISMFEALSNRDSVDLKTHCSADITLYEYGQIWTLDTLIYKAIQLNTATDFKRFNTFEFIETATDKNIAWVTYKLTSVIIKEGKQTKVQWLETVFLCKQKRHWKVKNLHSTLLYRE